MIEINIHPVITGTKFKIYMVDIGVVAISIIIIFIISYYFNYMSDSG
jgi:hypothetical protein